MQSSCKLKGGPGLDNSWQAVRLILPFFRQYRQQLLIGFMSLLAVNGLQLIIPRIIKHAVDGLQNEGVSSASLMFLTAS